MEREDDHRPARSGGNAPDRFLCHVCGYDLSGFNAEHAIVRCPECGRDNVPGDERWRAIRVGPWPNPARIAAGALWPMLMPGAGLLVLIPVGATEWVPLLATLSLGGWIVWPAYWITSLYRTHVPVRRRQPWLLVLALAGIAANALGGFVLAMVALRIV